MTDSSVPQTKKCSKCGEGKGRDEFGPDKRARDGLKSECRFCKRADSRKYYANNREKILEKERKRYTENREKERERGRIYRENNKEKVAESSRRYRQNNREKVNARVREWQKANPEKIRGYSRKYYRNNRSKEIARGRKFFEENPDYQRDWREANRDRINAKERERTRANPKKRREKERRYRRNNPDAFRAKRERRRARKKGATVGRVPLKRDILARQGGRCHWCGRVEGRIPKHGKGHKWELDHVNPLAGDNPQHTADNLVVSCWQCNNRKGSKSPHQWAQENGRLL